MFRNIAPVYAIVMACLYGVIFFLKLFWGKDGADYVIPIFVFFTFLHSLRQHQWHFHLLPLALLCAFIGDVSINLTPWREGALIFCVTHICLLTQLFRIPPTPKQHISPLSSQKSLALLVIRAIQIAIATLAFSLFLTINTASTAFSLKFFGVMYIFLVSCVAWRGLLCVQRNSWLPLGLGCLLFFLTDILVIHNVLTPATWLTLSTWLVYPPALFFLSIAPLPQNIPITDSITAS